MLKLEEGYVSPASDRDDQLPDQSAGVIGDEEEGRNGAMDDEEESSTCVDFEPKKFDESGEDSGEDSDDEECHKTTRRSRSRIESKSTQDVFEVGGVSSDGLGRDSQHDFKLKKKRSKRSDQKAASSTSLLSEDSSKDIKTKKKKKKKQNKEKRKKSKKKKKKGDSRTEVINDETIVEVEEIGNTADCNGAAINRDATNLVKIDDSDLDSDLDSDIDDEAKKHSFMMTSLRQSEKARETRDASFTNEYDPGNDGLWVNIDKDSDSEQNNDRENPAVNIKKKRVKKNKRKSRKSDWESSVKADESAIYPVYNSDDSELEIASQDYSSRQHGSTVSLYSVDSTQSGKPRSCRSFSRRSGRSIGSFNGSARSSDRSSFRSFKDERNTFLKRSLQGETRNDTSSQASETSDSKPLSRIDLRKDLEAQAEARIEKSSSTVEKEAILAVLQNTLQLASVLEGEVGCDGDDKKRKKGDDEKEDSEKEDDDVEAREDGDGKTHLDRLQKWLSFKEKARSRKGYIVFVSIAIALFLIANIVLIVYLAR